MTLKDDPTISYSHLVAEKKNNLLAGRKKSLREGDGGPSRAVARLLTPGGQDKNIPQFVLIFLYFL